MTADPRVEAVAAVMRRDGWTCDYHEPVDDPGECPDCDEAHTSTAARVVAALDAHDATRAAEGHALPGGIGQAMEADLRERIAAEIGQEWQRRSDEWGYRVDSHQEGVLDGLAEAEEIARGIDPGEVE